LHSHASTESGPRNIHSRHALTHPTKLALLCHSAHPATEDTMALYEQRKDKAIRTSESPFSRTLLHLVT
jgi:hypothetical protein